MSKKAWRTKFEEARTNPPREAGTVITTIDGSPIAVHLAFPEGKPPFFYAIMHLTTIVGAEVGWHARSINDKSKERMEGHKLILMSRSRTLIIRAFGVALDVAPIDALRLHHVSESGKSLVVELPISVKQKLEAMIAAQARETVQS